MRVLATSQPAVGHLHPVFPLLRAPVRAGHEVLVASSAPTRPWVERAGLPFAPAGLDWLESRYPDTFPEIVALRVDPPRLVAFLMHAWHRLQQAARALPAR